MEPGFEPGSAIENPARRRPLAEDRVIRFENVGLRYGLGPEVLRDLTFRIEPKSF